MSIFNLSTRRGSVGTNVLLSLCAGCALIVTALNLRREFGEGREAPRLSLGGEPIKGWEDLARRGQRIGAHAAKLQIVEFGDFQCPVCRAFALGGLAGALRKYPAQISVVYRHYPLSYHPHARWAAATAECASEQGRFVEMHDALYELQDSIGPLREVDFAARAGVPDLESFARCLQSDRPGAAIEADIQAARLVEATGTPTIFLNGRRLRGAPDSTVFLQLVVEALGRESD